MSEWQVLDLFCGLGGFSAAFDDSDRWDVTTIDIEARFNPDMQADVLELRPGDFDREFDVVLASPPCTDFSMACLVQKWDVDPNRSPKYVPKWESVSQSIALVFHTLWLIHELNPNYWFVENPSTGMLRQIIGRPHATVHYCQYGSEFKKPTGLWGNIPPMEFRTCPGKPQCDHVSNPSESNAFRNGTSEAAQLGDVERSAKRAKVPYELSESIRKAVEEALENPSPEQATLMEVNTDG